ncbi:MAG: hypothetical protein HW400_149 [Candidatus Levybacteria bacterium]|nr:hypothetical protein [Candidatus Levybacteria bacterium]
MDNIMLEKIKDLLANNEKIGITVGKNPGVDEMAAALALYLALSETKKEISVVCPTDPIVEVSSLVGIDKVKKSFAGDESGDLTVTFPYKEGEIEKISYTLEEGKLNILVKAGVDGLSFNEKDVEFRRKGTAPGLVFVVGTPRISDLGTAFEMEVLKDSKIINIDYKPENQGFGDVPLLGKNASSVSELMANFISSLDLKMDEDIASNLLAGIIGATDNFQSANTSPLAFETAAMLLKKGAVRKTKDGLMPEAQVDAFFSPKFQAKAGEKQAALAKEGFGEPEEERKPEVKVDENNPPDDWLAPKIYKGSTNV